MRDINVSYIPDQLRRWRDLGPGINRDWVKFKRPYTWEDWEDLAHDVHVLLAHPPHADEVSVLARHPHTIDSLDAALLRAEYVNLPALLLLAIGMGQKGVQTFEDGNTRPLLRTRSSKKMGGKYLDVCGAVTGEIHKYGHNFRLYGATADAARAIGAHRNDPLRAVIPHPLLDSYDIRITHFDPNSYNKSVWIETSLRPILLSMADIAAWYR